MEVRVSASFNKAMVGLTRLMENMLENMGAEASFILRHPL